jgi:hypothetical protein
MVDMELESSFWLILKKGQGFVSFPLFLIVCPLKGRLSKASETGGTLEMCHCVGGTMGRDLRVGIREAPKQPEQQNG